MNRFSRRTLLGGVGGVLGAGAGCLSLPGRSSFDPGDWSQVQADAGKTNYSPTPGPVEDADVAWRQSFDAPDSGFYASLTLADGTVYVGDNDGSVYAFALADGTERWRIESEGETGAYEPIGRTVEPIVVGDGRLYLWDGQAVVALEEP